MVATKKVSMKRPRRLSATFVKTVNQPGRYGDGRGGHGLSLLVKPMAAGGWSKTWAQRLRIDGRLRDTGLGRYPVVSLARARSKALANCIAVEEGRDPLERVARIPTFREATEKTIEVHVRLWKPGSKTEKQWRSTFEKYVYPRIGAKAVDRITARELLAILAPLSIEKAETAKKVRQRLSMVCKWSVTQGHLEQNPVDTLNAALPRNGKVTAHHRALPHAEVGPALAKVRESRAWKATKVAFEYLVLTACRSSEVRGARWSEVDLENRVWVVPAERMKMKREHRVPLTGRVLEVLAEARTLADESGLVFPSPTGRVLSDSTISKLVRENGIKAVPHGFRSSFRDWCGESGQLREVAEAALAHSIANKTESAYARSDLFERRRALMESWAAYVTATREGA